MCGRYVATSSPARLAERFHVDEVAVEAAEPDYNVTPRARVDAIRERDHRRVLTRLRWGLVPPWAETAAVGDRLINARAESLATKPAFRRAFRAKRCIIPADGFYEWAVVEAAGGEGAAGARGGEGAAGARGGEGAAGARGGVGGGEARGAARPRRARKQPWFVRARDGEPLAFAGLWEVWHTRGDGPDDGDGWLRSCVIVTTRATPTLAPIHDRMPVVLPESAWDVWLDPAVDDVETLRGLLLPPPDDVLEAYPVRPLVNSPRHNGPELIERLDAPPAS